MMRLDLTDEETFSLLNLLTETLKRPLSAVASHPDLAGHPREIRADRARTATVGQTAHTGGARLQPAPAGAFTATLGDQASRFSSRRS